MIRLQIAHARKQMRTRRPDLASKELASAAEWERPEAPDALLRIARGLVGMQGGEGEPAEARLREGVALAGGGVPGWFRAVLEAELMRVDEAHAGRLRKELAEARGAPPSREGIMAVIAEVGPSEAGEDTKLVSGSLLGLRAWLERGAGFDWRPDEFQALAETFVRFATFDLLEHYARAARRRSPTDAPARFYQIVARTRGQADRLSAAEASELMAMAQAATGREEFHLANRIDRFLDGDLLAGPGGRRRGGGAPAGAIEAEAVELLAETLMGDMPRGAADGLRSMVREFGRDFAIAALEEQFRSEAFGPAMPEPLLRELCETVVARALGGPAPRGRPQRRGRA
jgi:hypothetical protein